jgi:hypothetical protein
MALELNWWFKKKNQDQNCASQALIVRQQRACVSSHLRCKLRQYAARQTETKFNPEQIDAHAFLRVLRFCFTCFRIAYPYRLFFFFFFLFPFLTLLGTPETRQRKVCKKKCMYDNIHGLYGDDSGWFRPSQR